MRALINALPAMGSKTGVGHYTAELVRGLREVGPEMTHAFPDGWIEVVVRGWFGQRTRYEARARQPGLLPRADAALRRVALALTRRAGLMMPSPFRREARRGYDLYHEPNFIPLPCELPTVATVHDLSILLHPEWHPPRRVRFFERAFQRGLARCCHLLAISEFGRKQIIEHLGWPANRISVTWMGVRPGLRRLAGQELTAGLAGLGLTAGYLLHVGTLEPRKNLATLLRAYCGLPATVRQRHPLVLAGGVGWNSAELHDYLDREARPRGVRWLGYVAEDRFAALYSGARALLFPTLYEGFGMPTVEMMACGGAVIASTAGAVAEVAGGKAHLVEPRDEHGWRDAMLRVCRDDNWWRALRQGGEEVAARYTWRDCAERTLEAYRRAVA